MTKHVRAAGGNGHLRKRIMQGIACEILKRATDMNIFLVHAFTFPKEPLSHTLMQRTEQNHALKATV